MVTFNVYRGGDVELEFKGEAVFTRFPLDPLQVSYNWLHRNLHNLGRANEQDPGVVGHWINRAGETWFLEVA